MNTMQLISTENEAISHLVSDSCPPLPGVGTEAIHEIIVWTF